MVLTCEVGMNIVLSKFNLSKSFIMKVLVQLYIVKLFKGKRLNNVE